MELLLKLLLTTLVVEAIGWIGSDALANLASFPSPPLSNPHLTTRLISALLQVYTPFAPASKAQKQQKADILKLRAELAATSAQDEFSKWARLRRKLDKAVQDLEQSSPSALPRAHPACLADSGTTLNQTRARTRTSSSSPRRSKRSSGS